MDQAFNNFNSGKYKEAFNGLNNGNINAQSYEPNLAILQYLNNGRTSNASHVCIRKLNSLIAKKNKKDNQTYDQMTLQLMKYNIGILMLLNGKKENAYLLISDVYNNQKCFIDYLKYRMFLLLMELNISLKKNFQALNLLGKYNIIPYESKLNSNMWISLLFHEHSRSSGILKQQLDFILKIYQSQILMQLGIKDNSSHNDHDRQLLLQALLDKARKRKNNANKFYELNLQLFDRFYQAQKHFYQNNCEKSIQLLYFSNIQCDLQKMPPNKIITNIYSSLSYNNIGIIHYSYGKSHIALNYFNKAQTLLSKGCTGVEDKDLQLFSSNYSSHGHKIYYNMGIVSLSVDPNQAYIILEQLKKNNTQCFDYKYWYRIGQAQLQHFHQTYTKISRQNREIILESALKSFSQSLYILSKKQIPMASELVKNIQQIKQQEIQIVIMKIKGEIQSFKQNINLIICYISLLLHQYHKVIKHGKILVENQKTQQTSKIYALQYMMEAYTKLQKHKNALKCVGEVQKLIKSYKNLSLQTNYFKKNELIRQKMEMDSILNYQHSVLKIRQNNVNQAKSIIQKQGSKKNTMKSEPFKILSHYLKSKCS